MKKTFLIILFCSLTVLIAGITVFILWQTDAFVFDRSAQIHANHATWKGRNYSPISGQYSEGKTLAKDKDSGWKIIEVEEDPSHTFISIRSFLDDYLMVADDYEVPTSGELTTAYWNRTYITDTEFLHAVSQIAAQRTTSFTYKTDGIERLTDTQQMKKLYFAYEDCPIATNYIGYLGKVNGEWVMTTEISQADYPNPYFVSCYKIPEEYWDILSEHFR